MKNIAKEKILKNELCLGVGLRQTRTADIGKIMSTCGYDWLFIDMEHNSMDIDIASQISVAAQDAGITPIVRVPDFAHHHATRVLDCGAMGIVFPHVDDATTAQRLVSNCLYPPNGHRSMTGVLPQLDFKQKPIAEVAKLINDSMLIVIMLESPEAISNVDSIAAVEGVDVILIGTNDLCMEMGIPGDYNNSKVKEAYRKVIEACKKHGKTPGMGGVYNEELMSEYIGMGMKFILSGSDLSFMMQSASQRSNKLRSFV
jgi:2-keto-3-deoxy-L-rhamnonate aldolase RhmA